MSLSMETHYTPAQIAKKWGYSPQKIRRMFTGLEGVLLDSGPSGRTTLRIPESVVDRVHTDRSKGALRVERKSTRRGVQKRLLCG